MKTLLLNLLVILTLLLTAIAGALAQVGISTDNSEPESSAMLDVKSTNKGLLIPRMTQSQIEAIASPANGLQVFCTTDGKMYIYGATPGHLKEVAYGTGTILPFSCGDSITINHDPSGGVAPVDKTVTYGTVTNIPGEPSKCWITSNLGSDHQAIAGDDATEASAGWYWQFNRKQGYKHDGTTRTPNTTWISNINENLDWQAANDPCALELGNGWRLPTKTEWSNVGWSGNWWNGGLNVIWNSVLKLHAAGILSSSTGSLYPGGEYGDYWSSIQSFWGPGYDYRMGTDLWFCIWGCDMMGNNKAFGMPLRCIRDWE